MGEGEKWPYREGEYICACVRLVMDTIYYDDDHIERRMRPEEVAETILPWESGLLHDEVCVCMRAPEVKVTELVEDATLLELCGRYGISPEACAQLRTHFSGLMGRMFEALLSKAKGDKSSSN